MKLKRYAVTAGTERVREFWTFGGALRCYVDRDYSNASHLFVWNKRDPGVLDKNKPGAWREIHLRKSTPNT